MRSIGRGLSSAPRAHLSGDAGRIVAYAILGVLWMRPFWTHPTACAMGLHDWAYPCLDGQRDAYLPSLIAPWWDTDLGIAHALPQITLPWMLLGALVRISPALGLRLFILAAFVAAAVAADVALERLFGASRSWTRLIAGSLYAGSPFLATKLTSGQLGFIACAALVPAAFVALDSVAKGGGVRAWAACALCAASAFAQVQVGLALLLLLPLIGSGRVRARVWLGVWAIAAVTWMPAAYATIVAYRSGVLAPEAQLSVWLADKSVPWQHALDGTAYFADYFVKAAPSGFVYGFEAFSVLAFAFGLTRAGYPRRLALCAVALGLFATGTAGPIGSFVTWFMDRYPAAQIFRESYDLLFLAPLVIACGTAVAVDRLDAYLARYPSVRTYAVVGQCVIVAGLLFPAISGGAASLVPLVGDLPRAPVIAGDDRILWLPATPPIGPPNSIGGADPYQLSLDLHPDSSAFHPTGLLAYVDALADRDRPVSKAMLQRLDVVDSIVRRGLASQRIATSASIHEGPVAPTAAPAAPAGASILAIAAGTPSCEPDLRGTLMRDLVAYVPCAPAWSVVPREDAATSTDDPARSWIGGERWALLDPNLAEPRWPVLFTRSTLTYAWTQPAGGITWVYPPTGAVLNGSNIARADRWRPLSTKAGANTLKGDGKGIVAISASLPAAPMGRASPTMAQELPMKVTSSDRLLGSFKGVVPAHQRSFIVLRARWSADWRATVGGRDLGPPQVADGYAAGWRLDASARTSDLSIEFAPSAPYVAMLAISWLALVALVALCARGYWTSAQR